MTIHDALTQAAVRLKDAGVAEDRIEAEAMLAVAMGTNRAGVVARMREELDEGAGTEFRLMVDRRVTREPVQYIFGYEVFRDMPFRVTPDVLIPRPETEILVMAAVRLLKRYTTPLVADIGTGSGCIAVSVAAANPDAVVYAVDSSWAALEVAKGNAERNGVSGRVWFLHGDLLAPLDDTALRGGFDMILSNPPYIPSREVDGLQPEVRFEPRPALDGGWDGLDAVWRLISGAPSYLRPGGLLIAEIGFEQADAVKALVDEEPALEYMDILPDFAGIERVLIAVRIERAT
ncbi:MAG: peptide chain release factor N(5)-glutamine methyltransferase [Nitrospirae bacterium]|nr:peptide chain release factor N(5)-glutamine methyltransferase [Nitrospirota bacterium]